VAHETGDSLGISNKTDSFLCALQAEMEETVDDLKLKTGTVFSVRHELQPKKDSTFKHNQA
jgi:hypothetical protein